ncbi:beta-galactosidase [Nomia melanderi]|uniref:beta-galactosidase n=1 Tax=Nomia melanderi TaxID=2448451 RepID=UPI0013044AFB|nr:beta-galactosidase-like [Nomia melanderi]XP_031837922.1 beta-galactosidase-like [Nomia melanderi]XP_031837923.1 beta-galactosidase-like [Nomia melanderi]XP_031837924.1 beta-galactosidase-like [Nomia melanderi]XP_031837925.1 beta-galactosidase-like [Nomia melanderi]XP_031837926.1 beta-galactosidase-like [Nomia melanderi]XP_031837927.1 beta-galactosidase-like [Nomia melanderi]XP_031837928.1 beta-galactosidase-like [Nomia melanderi]XP_031837929.1 beta-galactosidase-like [Nomia melanderi]XP
MLSLLLALTVACAFGETADIHGNNSNGQTFGFEVDYQNNQFLLDGKPFRYVSGSFHYFRAPKRYWRDHLRKMRAAGLNAVSTYVEWSLHEPEENEWNWSGDADLVEFLNIAQEEDLLVLLRPGPYICAERDFGGLPYWLLTRVPDIRLRTNDPRYMNYVQIYLNEVFKRVEPLLRGNGGPIIMVQVENEYGSYGCDYEYLNHLRDIMKEKIGTKALLYTTDGNNANMVSCGSILDVYATVDFGTGVNVTRSFEVMRRYQPRGPLVNSEFYPGWLTHWGETFQRVKNTAITKTLDEMLALGASVNMYMFYGGTNFGYTAGANGGEDSYNPQITSYDYDAPLTEAGDPTSKYFEIRNVISKYLPLPNMSLPSASPKGDYGSVRLFPVVNLFEPLGRHLLASIVAEKSEPLTFESLGLSNWLMLYEADLIGNFADPANLHANVRDRGMVYVDDYLVGTLSRTENIYNIAMEIPYARKLKILVENQGRLNFGKGLHDYKGVSNVTLNKVPLGPWKMTGYRLDDIGAVQTVNTITVESGILRRGPVIFRGKFTVNGAPMDTYLNTDGWGKGVAFVNGRNLGRYWPLIGPQVTLYVPAPFLRTGDNEIFLVELEYVPSNRTMKLQDTPILG